MNKMQSSKRGRLFFFVFAIIYKFYCYFSHTNCRDYSLCLYNTVFPSHPAFKVISQVNTQLKFGWSLASLVSPKPLISCLSDKTKSSRSVFLYVFQMTGILCNEQEGSNKIYYVYFSCFHHTCKHTCLGAY
jgi:hypothetical protein